MSFPDRLMAVSDMLNVHLIESFGATDGPGIRFIVFLKGCPLRCRYCHNPDAWAIPEGQMRTADDIIAQALKYRSYWGKKGGITISGGEPLCQMDGLTELCRKAKEAGIHVAIDSCGALYPSPDDESASLWLEKFDRLMQFVDLVLFDIKHIDSDRHKWLTGKPNGNILACARHLSDMGKPMWIRHVLVPGINDSEEYLLKTREFIDTLKTVEKVEVLPYHTLGVFKWEELKIPYPLKDVLTPTQEQIEFAESILCK